MSAESKIAFLFPGQGSQKPGMLARLRQHPAGAELLSEAGNVLAQDPLEFDNAEAQTGTRATQLGLLIAGVASAHLLAAERVMPDFVAGHSVGAFAAAVHAQVLRFADALRLVDLRGRLMAEAYPHGYGMVAISGVPERTLQDWIDAARARDATLHLANRNAPRQFTVSGADADLAALLAHARAHGAGNAVRLAVAVPSHSPLMAGVAARMGEAIGAVRSTMRTFRSRRIGVRAWKRMVGRSAKTSPTALRIPSSGTRLSARCTSAACERSSKRRPATSSAVLCRPRSTTCACRGQATMCAFSQSIGRTQRKSRPHCAAHADSHD